MADEKPEKLSGKEAVSRFMTKVNTVYKGDMMRAVADARNLAIKRFSSGILELDCALGGGWPFNRISLIAGEYSSGKTLLCLKAFEQIENYDRTRKIHKDFIKADDPVPFEPCRGLFIDVEGTFELGWAIANGFNAELHSIAQPEYSEQVCDVVKLAIRENIFDLIVVDSLATMTPSKEIEASAEDSQMGLHARLINKAMRTWQSSINYNSRGNIGPAIIVINQFRMQIGMMFGDPRTLPGGKGQNFHSSIMVYLKPSKVVDSDTAGHGVGQYGGVIHKNKTYTSKINYTYTMALKDVEDMGIGEVDNLSALMKRGKELRVIAVVDGKVRFDGKEFKTQKEFAATIASSEILRRKLWRTIVKTETNAMV